MASAFIRESSARFERKKHYNSDFRALTHNSERLMKKGARLTKPDLETLKLFSQSLEAAFLVASISRFHVYVYRVSDHFLAQRRNSMRYRNQSKCTVRQEWVLCAFRPRPDLALKLPACESDVSFLGARLCQTTPSLASSTTGSLAVNAKNNPYSSWVISDVPMLKWQSSWLASNAYPARKAPLLLVVTVKLSDPISIRLTGFVVYA